MTRSSSGRRAVGLLALAAVVAACTRGAPAPMPPAPTPPAPVAATPAPATPAPHVHAAPVDPPVRGAAADVRFLQQMLQHHAQALVMTRLVPTRTARTDLLRLAERIDVSQRDEIDQMGTMLRRRGAAVPADTGHAAHAMMPGMLTPAEVERLGAATGPAFERLFLEGMIRHHEGALVMVRDYLGTPGVAQDPLLFQFANDIDADQRAEIRRMRALLDAMPRQP